MQPIAEALARVTLGMPTGDEGAAQNAGRMDKTNPMDYNTRC